MAPIVCRAPVCGRVPWTPVALPPSFAACWAWICRGAVAVSVVIAAHSFPTEQHVPVAGSARVAAVAYLSIVPARLIPSRCVPYCVRVPFVRLVQTTPAPASNEHARASPGHHRRPLPARPKLTWAGDLIPSRRALLIGPVRRISMLAEDNARDGFMFKAFGQRHGPAAPARIDTGRCQFGGKATSLVPPATKKPLKDHGRRRDIVHFRFAV